jgi:hypothetical protein
MAARKQSSDTRSGGRSRARSLERGEKVSWYVEPELVRAIEKLYHERRMGGDKVSRRTIVEELLRAGLERLKSRQH